QSGRLILLIRQVIGAPDEWAPLGGVNRGLGGFRPGGGVPVEEEQAAKDPSTWNDLGFYPPAMALVVKATSRVHTSLGGTLGGVRRGGGEQADLGINRDGVLVLRKGDKRNREVNVANAGGGEDDKDPKNKGRKSGKKMTELDAKKIWEE